MSGSSYSGLIKVDGVEYQWQYGTALITSKGDNAPDVRFSYPAKDLDNSVITGAVEHFFRSAKKKLPLPSSIERDDQFVFTSSGSWLKKPHAEEDIALIGVNFGHLDQLFQKELKAKSESSRSSSSTKGKEKDEESELPDHSENVKYLSKIKEELDEKLVEHQANLSKQLEGLQFEIKRLETSVSFGSDSHLDAYRQQLQHCQELNNHLLAQINHKDVLIHGKDWNQAYLTEQYTNLLKLNSTLATDNALLRQKIMQVMASSEKVDTLQIQQQELKTQIEGIKEDLEVTKQSNKQLQESETKLKQQIEIGKKWLKSSKNKVKKVAKEKEKLTQRLRKLHAEHRGCSSRIEVEQKAKKAMQQELEEKLTSLTTQLQEKKSVILKLGKEVEGIGQLSEEKSKISEELERLRTDFQGAQKAITSKEQKIKELVESLKELNTTNSDIAREKQKLEHELGLLGQELTNEKRTTGQQKENIEELQRQLVEKNEQLSVMEAKNKELERQNREISEEKDKAITEQAPLREEIETLKREIGVLEESFRKSSTQEKQKLEQELNQLREELTNEKRTTEQQKETIEGLQRQLVEKSDQLSEMETKNKELERLNQELSEEKEKAITAQVPLREEIERLKRETGGNKKELEKLIADLRKAKEDLESKSQEHLSAKKELEEATQQFKIDRDKWNQEKEAIVADHKKKVEELEIKLREAQKGHKDSLEAQAAQNTKEKDELKRELEETKRKLEELNNSISATSIYNRETANAMQLKLTDLEESKSRLEESLKKSEEEANSLKEELERHKVENQHLQKTWEDYSRALLEKMGCKVEGMDGGALREKLGTEMERVLNLSESRGKEIDGVSLEIDALLKHYNDLRAQRKLETILPPNDASTIEKLALLKQITSSLDAGDGDFRLIGLKEQLEKLKTACQSSSPDAEYLVHEVNKGLTAGKTIKGKKQPEIGNIQLKNGVDALLYLPRLQLNNQKGAKVSEKAPPGLKPGWDMKKVLNNLVFGQISNIDMDLSRQTLSTAQIAKIIYMIDHVVQVSEWIAANDVHITVGVTDVRYLEDQYLRYLKMLTAKIEQLNSSNPKKK